MEILPNKQKKRFRSKLSDRKMVKKSPSRTKKSAKSSKKKIAKKSKSSAKRTIRSSKPSPSKPSPRRGATKKAQKSTATPRTEEIVVRIMGQGQYRLNSNTADKLNEIDNDLIKIIQSAPHQSGIESDGLHQRFRKMLGEMTRLVTSRGKQVSASEIIPSDLILPPEDISIDGARELFEGEGLMPN